MMRLNNGEWITLAGTPGSPDPLDARNPAIYRPGYGGDVFRLVGSVTSGRITERWARVVR